MPSSAPRKRTQLDPSQTSITSFFGPGRSSSPSSTAEPAPSLAPVLPGQIQAGLLSVGMRVRKSVPEGYKSGSYAFNKYTPITTASSTFSTPSFAAADSRGLSSSQESSVSSASGRRVLKRGLVVEEGEEREDGELGRIGGTPGMGAGMDAGRGGGLSAEEHGKRKLILPASRNRAYHPAVDRAEKKGSATNVNDDFDSEDEDACFLRPMDEVGVDGVMEH